MELALEFDDVFGAGAHGGTASVQSCSVSGRRISQTAAAANPPGPLTPARELPPLNANEARIGRRRLDSFSIKKVIGSGAFGRVLLVQHSDSGGYFAMKVMKKEVLLKRNDVQAARTERNVLAMLAAKDILPFIVRLHAAFQTTHYLYLIEDFVNGGDLTFHLKREQMFSENTVRFYAAEIVVALTHLHEHHVIHRDLKPENILLDVEGHVVVTDMGLAKERLDETQGITHSWCGTEEYMAPEVVAKEGHGAAADWWSLGALIYDMLAGEPPFVVRPKNRKKLHQKILKAQFKLPGFLSREAHSILKSFLTRDPAKRLTSPAQIREHPFFNPIDWSRLADRALPPPIVPRELGLNSSPSCTACVSPTALAMAISPSMLQPSPQGGFALTHNAMTPLPNLVTNAQDIAQADTTTCDDLHSLFKGFSFVAPDAALGAHFQLAGPTFSNTPQLSIPFTSKDPSPQSSPSLEIQDLVVTAEVAEFIEEAHGSVEILTEFEVLQQ